MSERTAQYRERWERLKQQRTRVVEAKWKEIAEYFCPDRGKFWENESSPDTSQTLRGSKILDSTGQDALETATNGLFSGLTPSSRPWFRLVFKDDDLNEVQGAKSWLERLQELMYSVCMGSNFYPSMQSLNAEVLAFAQGCLYMESESKHTVRYRVFTAGEYWLDQNHMGQVDTVYRRIMMTARQMVQRFDENRVSRNVMEMAGKDPTKPFEVVHCVQPRNAYDVTKVDSMNQPFESLYFETGADFAILQEGGFRRFPYLTPRYSTVGNDVYGSGSPGWKKLPDIKMLQDMEESKLRTIHKIVDPPMMAPSSLKGQPLRSGHGGITYYDSASPDNLRPLYQVQGRVNELTEEMAELRQRIMKGYYVDIFLMIEQIRGGSVTATEVLEKVEEKKLQLGPFIERHQSEVLIPTLEFQVEEILRQGLIEPPPDEVIQADYDIEFISQLAQSQKQSGARAIDETIAFIGNTAAINPDIIDLMDFDEAFIERANLVGLPLKLIRGKDVVVEIRKLKRAQEAEEKAQMQAQAMVQGAQQLSQTSTDPNQPNALTDIAKMLQQQSGGIPA
jgi:hypothetical protein